MSAEWAAFVFSSSKTMKCTARTSSPTCPSVSISLTRHAVWIFCPAASGSCQKLGKPKDDIQADKLMACGKLVLRPESNRAYWNRVDVSLTVGEHKIVHLLASNTGCF